MKGLLTGASGFLGGHIMGALAAKSEVARTVASRGTIPTSSVEAVRIPDLAASTDWSGALCNQQIVIHAAARAHIMKDNSADPLAEYQRVNVDGTLNFVRQSAVAGVRRFIFISSIGVNGNTNTQPVTEEDTPIPAELYAQSKWEAEQGLWEVQCETGMELVINRPPLMYGPNAPGNFGS